MLWRITRYGWRINTFIGIRLLKHLQQGVEVVLDNLEGDESLAQNLEEDQPKGDVLQKMNVPTAIRKGIEKKIVQKYPKWRQKEPEANLIQEGNEDNLVLIV